MNSLTSTSVHADNIETNDIRYRQKAWEFLCEIKTKKWKISHDCDHLLERDECFSIIFALQWIEAQRKMLERTEILEISSIER